MQRALCCFCAACGIAAKAFGLLLQPHPWIGLINLGLRADRVLQGRDEGLELPQEGWINGGHSAGVSLWEGAGRKHLAEQGLILQSCSPALLSERGQVGMLWVLVRSQGVLLGQNHGVQSFAQCRQGSKAGPE